MTTELHDLAQSLLSQGVTTESLAADREAIAHNMLAEDFLAHIGIAIPEDPDDDWFDQADDVIAHYGVMGMKWGRRRPRGSNGLVDKTAAPKIDKSKLAGVRAKKAPKTTSAAKTMTTEELNAAIKRIELEQKYTALTRPTKNAMLSEVQKIAGNALRQNAQQYATQYLGKGVELLIREGTKQLAKK